MSKKSQAAKNGGEADLTTESAPERMITNSEKKVPHSERLQGASPSLSQSWSKKKVMRVCTRRSERIKNYCTPQDQKTQHVIEDLTLIESDEDDELPIDHLKDFPVTSPEKVVPELMLGEKNLEEKVDYVVQLLEAQGHTLNLLNTKVIRKSSSVKTAPAPGVIYKSMYIASQKKIEELVEENRELTRKLANAIDQFEAYKKGNQDGFEVLNKLKDVIIASNMSRVSEAAQGMHDNDKVVMSPDASDVPSAKRKKTKRNRTE